MDRGSCFILAVAGLALFACAEPPSTEGPADTGDTGGETDLPAEIMRGVHVTLDGEDLEGAIVIQGGVDSFVTTGPDGRALALVDTTIEGELVLMASHEAARTTGRFVNPDDDSEMLIELTSFAEDNPDYVFDVPGLPDDPGSSSECGHCHTSMKVDWYGSPHRTSASNPVVQDVYAGAAASLDDQGSCEAAGGQWWDGAVPGTDQTAPRCYLGAGVLPDLNEGCGEVAACDGLASAFGGCADCHAPAINGELGGRDLLEAVGTSFEAGVHCDLCHKVESVDLDAPAGVAGRLRVHRPSEPSPSPALGTFLPLSFGPYVDVPNPRMGSSPRDHFQDGELCAGCHQHEQAALVPGTSLDPARWPDDALPIQSTHEEWITGSFAGVSCATCHMPPNTGVDNSSNLDVEQQVQGVAVGWLRPSGSVRHHTWTGPRDLESGSLQAAAAIVIDKSVANGTLVAEVTVRNTGAGHAIPTGEPMRSMVLFVGARCGDEVLLATGGDAIPELGGWLDRKPSPADWSLWPGAEVGEVVRVVVDEGSHDYDGFGPFGDGSFDAAAKGLPIYRVVGQSTVTAVNGDMVQFDAPLPAGDVAYRGRASYFEATDPLATAAVAGAPGFGFARVLADAEGELMVPHHRAVDVVSDNRLLPEQEWTSTHSFDASCADPTVDAALVYRPYPEQLVRERGWDASQQVMAEASL